MNPKMLSDLVLQVLDASDVFDCKMLQFHCDEPLVKTSKKIQNHAGRSGPQLRPKVPVELAKICDN